MQKYGSHQQITGFTIIEVLVAVIIMAIGLLGLAAMQTLAIQDQQNAYYFSQASSLVYEMSDRIKVNPEPWKTTPFPSPTSPCNLSACNAASTCTPKQMADFDYCAWQTNVKSRMDDGTKAQVTNSGTSGVCSGGSSKLCLFIGWGYPPNATRTDLPKYKFELEISP